MRYDPYVSLKKFNQLDLVKSEKKKGKVKVFDSCDCDAPHLI
jgi:hypothetical protein